MALLNNPRVRGDTIRAPTDILPMDSNLLIDNKSALVLCAKFYEYCELFRANDSILVFFFNFNKLLIRYKTNRALTQNLCGKRLFYIGFGRTKQISILGLYTSSLALYINYILSYIF